MTDQPGFIAVSASDIDYTDPADLVDLALERAANFLPDWEPREGNVEVVLLEEIAPMVAALIARVDAVLPAVTAQTLSLSGLPKDTGTPAQVAVEVELSDTLGHTVPAGTAVILGDPNVDNPTVGVLDADVAVAAGLDVGTGTVTVDVPGEVADLSVATPVVLIDAVPYVDAVTVTSIVTPGTDPESDDAYLNRGSAWLASMTQLLSRASQFGARAITDPRVGRALGVQRWNGASGAPGDHAGFVTVMLLDRDGAAFDVDTLEAIRAWLAESASAELTVVAKTPTVTEVPVTVTVVGRAGYTSAAVQANVETALSEWLNVLTWEWGEDVLRSRLTALLETTEGVSSVTSIAAPAGDVTIAATGLATAGALTVTVT